MWGARDGLPVYRHATCSATRGGEFGFGESGLYHRTDEGDLFYVNPLHRHSTFNMAYEAGDHHRMMTAFFLKKLTLAGHATGVGHYKERHGGEAPPKKKRRR